MSASISTAISTISPSTSLNFPPRDLCKSQSYIIYFFSGQHWVQRGAGGLRTKA